MKKFFPVIVGLLSLNMSHLSNAQNNSKSDASSVLQNLIYYPHGNQFLFSLSYDQSLNESSGSKSESYSEINYSLAYGLPFLSGLRVQVQNDWQTASTTGGGSAYTQVGFSDPSFQLAYRWADSYLGALSADFSVSYTPAVITRAYPTNTANGNIAAAASTLSATASGYYTQGSNEFEVSSTLTRVFSGTANQAGGINSYTATPYWQGYIQLVDRYHFNSWFYVQGEVEAISGSQFAETFSSGSVNNYWNPDHIEPQLFVGFVLAPWLLLDGSIAYIGYTQSTSNANNPNGSANFRETYANFRVRASF